MRQRHSCISPGSNVDHNALQPWHATMHKFVTSMVRCGLGMQQCAMHNATIQKTTFLNWVYMFVKSPNTFDVNWLETFHTYNELDPSC